MTEKKVAVGGYKGLGAFLILLGVALISTSICDLLLTKCHYSFEGVSSGIWSGIFVLIAGVLSLTVGKNGSHGLLSTHLAFAIIACLMAIGPLVCGSIGLSIYLDDDNSFVISERPRVVCEGTYTTTSYDSYLHHCYYRQTCCECQETQYYNGTEWMYTFHYSYDFTGKLIGIVTNSLLTGLGLTAMITCIISATLFCKSTTCCPINQSKPHFTQGYPFVQSPTQGYVQQVQFQPGQMQMAQGQGPAQNFVYMNPALVNSQAWVPPVQQGQGPAQNFVYMNPPPVNSQAWVPPVQQ